MTKPRHDADTVAEMFPAETVAVESPRLRWIARHGLLTRDDGAAGEWGRWSAYRQTLLNVYDGPRAVGVQPNWVGYGDTEDAALADWARKHGRRMWFEEAVRLPAAGVSGAGAWLLAPGLKWAAERDQDIVQVVAWAGLLTVFVYLVWEWNNRDKN